MTPPLRPSRELSPQALFAVGAGALLAGFDLPVWVGPLPAGLLLRLVGAASLAGGLARLRPDAPSRRAAARDLTSGAGLVALWSLLQALDNLAPPAAGAPSALVGPFLGAGALAGACVLVGRTLQRHAAEAAWSFSRRAWRRVVRLGGACFGAAAAGLAVGFLLGLASGRPAPVTAGPLAFAARLFLALPPVAVAWAAAVTVRDQRQLARQPVGAVTRLTTRRAFAAATFALLLSPLAAVELPHQLHHVRTPAFDAFVPSAPVAPQPAPPVAGARQLETWQGPEWQSGRVAPFVQGEGYPRHAATIAHQLEVTIRHGAKTLVRVERELIATVDTATGEVEGARVVLDRYGVDPRFQLRVETRLDLDVPPEGAFVDGDLAVTVPFETWIALASGEGGADLRGSRVRGLGRPAADWTLPGDGRDRWRDAADVRAELGLPLPPPPTLRFETPGDAATRAPARPDQGLRHTVWVRGAVDYRQLGARRAVSTQTRFWCNTDEYSYAVDVVETVRVQTADAQPEPIVKRRSLRHQRIWDGRVW